MKESIINMEQEAPITGNLEQNTEKPKSAAELLAIARKQMEEAERAVAAEAAEEPEIPDELQEPVYNPDQLSIILCAEAISNVLEGLNPETRLAMRLEQAKFWLYYLGGMPEFLPRPTPKIPVTDQSPAPGTAGLESEFLSSADTQPALSEEEKNLNEISTKLGALTHKEIMNKEEPQKKTVLESGLDKLIPDFMKKKPEEKTVTPDHQPISLG